MPDAVSTPLDDATPASVPGLFHIKNSARDFSQKEFWGKNRINSAFPTALALYMESLGLPLVYLKLGDNFQTIKHSTIFTSELFGLDLASNEAYYDYEIAYTPFSPFVTNQAPKVDIQISSHIPRVVKAGFEIKLTVLPDDYTSNKPEAKWGSELVVRMPSIVYLACSIASAYVGPDRERLKSFFGANGFGNYNSYHTAPQVNPQLPKIGQILNAILHDNLSKQRPAIIQPIWKTEGKKSVLHENCLDMFVWSDLAILRLFLKNTYVAAVDSTKKISRPDRAVIQLFFMLHDYALNGGFNPEAIQNILSYETKNDKAFALSGTKTNPIMACPELLRPRIRRDQIQNIILNDGQKFLAPERRFDAAIVTSLGLFSTLNQENESN